eukprot:683651_1
MSRETLVVYGYIRRIDGLVSHVIPRQLYDICLQYCKDHKTLVYFQTERTDIDGINLLDATNIFDLQRKVTVVRYSKNSIETLNKDPHESTQFQMHFFLYDPTTLFAFTQSNIELPNHITKPFYFINMINILHYFNVVAKW